MQQYMFPLGMLTGCGLTLLGYMCQRAWENMQTDKWLERQREMGHEATNAMRTHVEFYHPKKEGK